MSLVDQLLTTRTPLELAKELAATAKDNAALCERVTRLETELFWLKVPAAIAQPIPVWELYADGWDSVDEIDANWLQTLPQGTRLYYLPDAATGECAWRQDADTDTGAWESSCGKMWLFIEGGPAENNVKFCQGCGKPVKITGVENE